MKKLLKGALIAACVLLTAGFAKAQTKIGYVNFQTLMTGAPEFAGITTNINAYQKTWADQIQGMRDELQKNASDYDSKKAGMTDALRTKTEGELQDLNKRIEETTNKAQTSIQAKYDEITKPLIDKLKGAINLVAKENGYTYVLDSSSTAFLVSPEADDLMARVKAKLGPGTPAAPATTPAKAPLKKN